MNNRFMKLMGCLIILVCFSGSGIAQILGIVVDKETQEAIPNVKLKYKIVGQGQYLFGSISDKNGKVDFNFKENPYVIWQAIIVAEGYEPISRDIYPDEIKNPPIKIELIKNIPKVKQVVVLEHKTSLETQKYLLENSNSIDVKAIGEKIVELNGIAEQVRRAEQLIKSYDVPPKEILVKIMLITANGGDRKNVEYDPKIKNIIKQLTSLFKYNYYWVVGQAEMIGMENEPLQIMNDNKQSTFNIETKLSLSDNIIKLERLKVFVNKPSRSELITTVNIKDGETVILGSSGGLNEGEAIIIAITAEIVK